MLSLAVFLIDYHFKSRGRLGERFEEELEICVFLKIFELCFGYALLGKWVVCISAQMYQEYYNIV